MKKTAYVHACLNYDKKIDYKIYHFNGTQFGDQLIQEVEIEFDEADYSQVVAGTVAAMREKQKQVQAEAQNEVTKIDRAINDLLGIGYDDGTIDAQLSEVSF